MKSVTIGQIRSGGKNQTESKTDIHVAVEAWQVEKRLEKALNSEVYMHIVSAQIQPNETKLIRQHFTEQTDNDPKLTTKATQEFLKEKKWNNRQWPCQSPDWACISHDEDKTKGRKTHEQTTPEDGCRKGLAQGTKEETQSLMMGSILQAVTACKGFSTKY